MFNECLEIRWKTAHFCILDFSFQNHFVWEVLLSIRHSVSSSDAVNTSKFVKNTPLRVVFSILFSAFHLVMKHCISCFIYYIQSFPILHNFKHPPFLFIENSQEIIQKCLLIMEPLFDWMKSWLVLEENMLK